MSNAATTRTEIVALATAVKEAKDLNEVREALIELNDAFREAQAEFGVAEFNDIDQYLDTEEIPVFFTPSVELPHSGTAIWSFDSERILVGATWGRHELYFTNHEGDRV